MARARGRGRGAVVGYAYAAQHRVRAAYRWAVDVGIYVDPARHRAGAGRMLYEALLELLRRQRLRSAVAGITLPNDASLGLHRALGFEHVGTYRAIGWKAGEWRDVSWWQLALAPDRDSDAGAPAARAARPATAVSDDAAPSASAWTSARAAPGRSPSPPTARSSGAARTRCAAGAPRAATSRTRRAGGRRPPPPAAPRWTASRPSASPAWRPARPRARSCSSTHAGDPRGPALMYDDARAAGAGPPPRPAGLLGAAQAALAARGRRAGEAIDARGTAGLRLAHQADVITRRLAGHAVADGRQPRAQERLRRRARRLARRRCATAFGDLLPDVVAPGDPARRGLPAGRRADRPARRHADRRRHDRRLRRADRRRRAAPRRRQLRARHDARAQGLRPRAHRGSRPRRVLAPRARRRLAARRRLEQRRRRAHRGVCRSRPRRARRAGRRVTSARGCSPIRSSRAASASRSRRPTPRRSRSAPPPTTASTWPPSCRASRSSSGSASSSSQRLGAPTGGDAQPDRRRDAQPPVVSAARRHPRPRAAPPRADRVGLRHGGPGDRGRSVAKRRRTWLDGCRRRRRCSSRARRCGRISTSSTTRLVAELRPARLAGRRRLNVAPSPGFGAERAIRGLNVCADRSIRCPGSVRI